MDDEEKIVSVPYFLHEAVCDKMERTSEHALEKMEASNRRMMMSLIVVCLTLIVTVCSFLVAYKHMNDTWIEFFDTIQNGEKLDDTILNERNERANPEAPEG